MLMRFKIANFRSIRDEMVLDLVPDNRLRTKTDHAIESQVGDRTASALPLMVVFGANAAGKSNLLRGISVARNCILGKQDTAVGRRKPPPFRLDATTVTAPSRFEFMMEIGGQIFVYGFSIFEGRVREEWLFVHGRTGREIRIFERMASVESGKLAIQFGRPVGPELSMPPRARLKYLGEDTVDEQLFLTEAGSRDIPPFDTIYKWFAESFYIILPGAEYSGIAGRLNNDNSFHDFIEKLIVDMDTGVSGLSVTIDKIKKDHPDFADNIRRLESIDSEAKEFHFTDRFMSLDLSDNENIRLLRTKTKHKGSDGQDVIFDVLDESDGTQRLMHLSPLLFETEHREKERGGFVFVVDELDRSLHPAATREFVSRFLRANSNSTGARSQLLVATHEPILLDLDLLRRDEICFIEKDPQGASHLTSLADVQSVMRRIDKSRARLTEDTDIEKGYLRGRFGGIPIFRRPRHASNAERAS